MVLKRKNFTTILRSILSNYQQGEDVEQEMSFEGKKLFPCYHKAFCFS